MMQTLGRLYASDFNARHRRTGTYPVGRQEVLPQQQIDEIRAYIQRQRALGADRFQLAVEHKLGRCASVRPAHRPPSEKAL
jgi:putative transposase